MEFEHNNFVTVNERTIIDPLLKIGVQEGGFDLESGSQQMEVFHDSEIRGDRLRVLMTDDDKKMYGVGRGPNSDMMPFRSLKHRSITSFSFNTYDQRIPSVLSIIFQQDDIILDKRLLLKGSIPHTSQHLDEFYIYVLRSILLIGTWDRILANKNRGDRFKDAPLSRISLLLRKPMADEIAAVTGEHYPELLAGLFCLASREAVL